MTMGSLVLVVTVTVPDVNGFGKFKERAGFHRLAQA